MTCERQGPAPAARARRGRRILRWLGWTLAALVLLVATLTGGGYWWLLQSLPQVDGEIEVAGLGAPVTIVRDRFAIPHIEAASLLDATFALGFAHAQDRLWQMEFRRRLGAGRLAEIVGAAAVPTDRFMRTLGLYRLSEASLAHFAPETLAWLEAYAEGVNAFLERRSGLLPPEFLILGHTALEPWRPADSLVWLRLMALDLGTNYRDELARARLAQRLSPEQIADLWPDYPKDAPTTLTALAASLPFDRLAAALPPAPQARVGSNAWALAGSRTASGAPLLANDPHLELRAPGVFYLARLETPEVELVGATLPGVPGVVLGHNGQIAWGFTNAGFDTQDLFIERIDPNDPTRYLTPEGSAAFATREEVIEVKGAAPVTFEVRETRHGPVLSDLVADSEAMFGRENVVALAWTGLAEDDVSLQALLDFARAHDWRGFVAALPQVASPIQNVLYADVGGHIGFYAPGRVPVRKAGDGRWPVPGWTGAYDWQGVIPFEALPHVLDPPRGAIVNANNRVVPQSYPYLLTADWEDPYRARRLAQLLEGDDFDPAAFATIQADELSLLAADLLPIMLRAQPASPAAAAAMAELRAWDRVMAADARAPLLFAAWYRELSRLIYADELGPLFRSFWSLRPEFMERVLTSRPAWCDDRASARVETCAERTSEALELALADLARRLGEDRQEWNWGRLHPARMAHPILGDQPLLGWLFNIEIAVGGDGTTVNAAHYRLSDEARPFTGVLAATCRATYDLADLDLSRFVAATGQSGNPLSRHYRDLTALWATGQGVAIDRTAGSDRENAVGVLRLHPSQR
jgi:penicillin amidase